MTRSSQTPIQSKPSDADALALADYNDTAALADQAFSLTEQGHGNVVTYSRKVFIPLTHLCRDVCHYCTFAKTPRRIEQAYMSADQVLALCEQGAAAGCQEALFTLGEKPELRYRAARDALRELGYGTTLEYVAAIAGEVLEHTGLLPHINAGTMTAQEISMLRPVSASMGIMLESLSPRLCEKDLPHYGSPDKNPAVRLETLELAGQLNVPFTTGILIGIGENRRERIESLLAIRSLNEKYGHIQEVIIQNFRAKPETRMAEAPEPDLEELLWTVAVARLIFGSEMNIQAPPNLSPGVLEKIIAAGINDWGGVSPLTPDHVNPEAPWPHLEQLARETEAGGKYLDQRLTIYPSFISNMQRWLDPAMHGAVMNHCDAAGFAKRDGWTPGQGNPLPGNDLRLWQSSPALPGPAPALQDIVTRCRAGEPVTEADIVQLFSARGNDFAFLIEQARDLASEVHGDSVSYVVNRNINYTNVCYFRCQFCAFSKGKLSENLRGKPYDISADELARRSREAWDRGATEVCLQGGIHPDYTGETYLDILRTVQQAAPGIHIHAFSPLEIWQGAATLGMELKPYLQLLKENGLNTLPGTAAEILDDPVREIICPDKLNTQQWLEVMATAHELGIRSTATIMFGHVDHYENWARHLLRIRNLQASSGGFTEFVPLPYVPMEAPLYLKNKSRKGPSFREAVLMHAVPRLVFHHLIDNIQASWVKMGKRGALHCLDAGANDLGGSLMNESITRAAGAEHGQEWPVADIESSLAGVGKQPRMRTTLYADPPESQRLLARNPPLLTESVLDAALKKQRSKKLTGDIGILQVKSV